MSLSVNKLRNTAAALDGNLISANSWGESEVTISPELASSALAAIRELIAIKEAEQMKRVNSPKFYSRQRGALEEVDEDLQALMDRDMED